MRESTPVFWLKVSGGALLVAALVIIYLGNSLFGQSTLLTHAAKDQAYAESQRDALRDLLAALAPDAPLEEVQAAAAAASLEPRVTGQPPAQRLVIRGLSFAVRDGIVNFETD